MLRWGHRPQRVGRVHLVGRWGQRPGVWRSVLVAAVKVPRQRRGAAVGACDADFDNFVAMPWVDAPPARGSMQTQ